jgi:hypothetical protein
MPDKKKKKNLKSSKTTAFWQDPLYGKGSSGHLTKSSSNITKYFPERLKKNVSKVVKKFNSYKHGGRIQYD